MAEHERATQGKQGEAEQKRRATRQEPQSSSGQLHAWDNGLLSMMGTPFRPPMDRHRAILARCRSDTQKAGFAMRLQQTYGNRYVQRLIASMGVQAKLTVSQPGDMYEQEADRVADAVTRSVNTPVQRQAPEEEELQMQEEEEEEVQPKPLLQLQPEDEEEKEEPVQAKPLLQLQPEDEEEEVQAKPLLQLQPEDEEEEEEEAVQTKPLLQLQPEDEEEVQAQLDENRDTTVPSDIESRINSARGGGQPLAETAREPMERAFGTDFSGVRVHTSPEANMLNQQISARAFTTGQDVFFREGEYSPGSDSGRKLIAHELTHVVQQTGSTPRSSTRLNKQEDVIDGMVHSGHEEYLSRKDDEEEEEEVEQLEEEEEGEEEEEAEQQQQAPAPQGPQAPEQQGVQAPAPAQQEQIPAEVQNLPVTVYDAAVIEFQKWSKWQIRGGKAKSEKEKAFNDYYLRKIDEADRRLRDEDIPEEARNEILLQCKRQIIRARNARGVTFNKTMEEKWREELPEKIYQGALKQFRKWGRWRIFGGKSKEARETAVRDFTQRNIERARGILRDADIPEDKRTQIIDLCIERIHKAYAETFEESIGDRLRRWFKGVALILEGLGTVGLAIAKAIAAISALAASAGLLFIQTLATCIRAAFDITIGGSQAFRGVAVLFQKTGEWFNQLLSFEGVLKSIRSVTSITELVKLGFGAAVGLLKGLRGWLMDKANIKGWRGKLAKGAASAVMWLENVFGWVESCLGFVAGATPAEIIVTVIKALLKAGRTAIATLEALGKSKEPQEEAAA